MSVVAPRIHEPAQRSQLRDQGLLIQYGAARLLAALLQGQRDFFGAQTYERTDQPRGKFFHIDWPEKVRPQIAI